MVAWKQLVPGTLLGVGLLLAVAPRADAGSIGVLKPKPDLRIAAVGPSPSQPGYVRVVVTNSTPVGAAQCWVRIDLLGHSLPYFSMRMVPAIGPYGAVAIDLASHYPITQPGKVTKATIDFWSDVAEGNEFNNVAYYVQPPG